MKKPRFNIGQQVYYNLPDGIRLLIINCQYSMRHDEWTYLACNEQGEERIFTDVELTETKQF